MTINCYELYPDCGNDTLFATLFKGVGYRDKEEIFTKSFNDEISNKHKDEVIRYSRNFLMKFASQFDEMPLELHAFLGSVVLLSTELTFERKKVSQYFIQNSQKNITRTCTS